MDFHLYQSEIEVDCSLLLVSLSRKWLVITDISVAVHGGVRVGLAAQ